MELNKWIDFSVNYEIPKEVEFINCDTRDFGCYFSTEKNSKANEIIKYAPDFCLVSAEFLLFVLNDIYIKSGGKGEWRHLETKDKHWVKYISFTRFNDTHFIMTTRDGEKYLSPNKLKDIINWENDYAYVDD